jgi:hypothetical protein
VRPTSLFSLLASRKPVDGSVSFFTVAPAPSPGTVFTFYTALFLRIGGDR